MSIDGFVVRETELGGIVVVTAGPRGVVASFYGPQPRLFFGEACGCMEIAYKVFDTG